MKYPSEQTHCPSCPERGSHFESDGQSAVIWQTLLVPEIIWEIFWRVSEYTNAQEKSAEFSQKSRVALCHSQSSSSQIKAMRSHRGNGNCMKKKHTTRTWDFFESHTEQRAFDGFLIFFFSAILFFSPKCWLARAVCCLALLLSSWPGLTCHVKQFLPFIFDLFPELSTAPQKSHRPSSSSSYCGAFLCEPVQGISNISNSPH